MNRSTFVHISVLIIISSAIMSSIMAKEIGLIKSNKDYQHDSTDKPTLMYLKNAHDGINGQNGNFPKIINLAG